MFYYNFGDTVEGECVDVQVRKWVPCALVKHPIVNKIMMRYKTDRNSQAVVISPLNMDNCYSTNEVSSKYHRNVGDGIKCDGMTVYVDCKRTLSVKHEGGVTHRHGAGCLSIRFHTIATISTPLSNLKSLIDKQSI